VYCGRIGAPLRLPAEFIRKIHLWRYRGAVFACQGILCIEKQGMPHPLTQRGNRRMQTFFSDDDYREYIALMAEFRRE
jgi:hypothetical protein